MKNKIKDKSKMQAGFARAEKYHQRNCDDLVQEMLSGDPLTKKQAILIRQTVEKTYALFRSKFRFFKK